MRAFLFGKLMVHSYNVRMISGRFGRRDSKFLWTTASEIMSSWFVRHDRDEENDVSAAGPELVLQPAVRPLNSGGKAGPVWLERLPRRVRFLTRGGVV